MLISKKLNAAINEEIGLEIFASNQYLAMSAYLEAVPLLAQHQVHDHQVERRIRAIPGEIGTRPLEERKGFGSAVYADHLVADSREHAVGRAKLYRVVIHD